MTQDPGDFQRDLSDLQLFTDSSLTQLRLDDLLQELLTRVSAAFEADTAAVLLLDEASGDLVARVAHGIEDEVRQGVRVPVGRGFAGRIAATKGPIRLDRVDATTVANPILWEKGIRVMLGVPLLAGDSVVGVLHVGRLDDRPFRPEDDQLLQIVADRIAGAVQARQLAAEQAAAALLERSLVPSVLPDIPELDMVTRYVPAEQRSVGGDWYDVFKTPSGDLWIVVGDVAGHGLPAAVVMGRIRSALRAYAILDLAPAEVMELVDRKVQHFEIGTIATLAIAVTRAPFDSIELAVAGHPPPAVAVPGESGQLVDVTVDLPLGVATGVHRSSTVFALEHGAVVAFYTDGLVERRGESLEVGLERLCDSLWAGDPASVAHNVMRTLVGHTTPEDDVALVVVRRL